MTQDEMINKIHSVSWYHKIELAPGVFSPGRYDPRPFLDQMGFPEDLTGKTVLDIGAADGFFTFEAEKRGAARVLAIDRVPAQSFGFALARDLLGSKAEHIMMSVYDLSPQIHGAFDVVFFMGVLYHLRHPLLAIEKVHSVCREYALVESHVCDDYFIVEDKVERLEEINPRLTTTPIMRYYPTTELNQDLSNWWAPNIRGLEQMLQTSGFRPERTGRWSDRVAFKAYRLDFKLPPESIWPPV